MNNKEQANGTNRKELASYYLTGEEVADYWRICTSSVYVLIRTGKLRACKICGQWLISPEAIIEYEEEKTQHKELSLQEKVNSRIMKIV